MRSNFDVLFLIALVVASAAIILALFAFENANGVILLKALAGSVIASIIVAYRVWRRRRAPT